MPLHPKGRAQGAGHAPACSAAAEGCRRHHSRGDGSKAEVFKKRLRGGPSSWPSTGGCCLHMSHPICKGAGELWERLVALQRAAGVGCMQGAAAPDLAEAARRRAAAGQEMKVRMLSRVSLLLLLHGRRSYKSKNDWTSGSLPANGREPRRQPRRCLPLTPRLPCLRAVGTAKSEKRAATGLGEHLRPHQVPSSSVLSVPQSRLSSGNLQCGCVS